MKLFECQNCGQPLYFENTRCQSCGLNLAYLPDKERITALEERDGRLRALAVPFKRYRLCANAQHSALLPGLQCGCWIDSFLPCLNN